MDNNFIFQQDGAPAHTARQAQEWLTQNCSDFLRKDEWPPNSPDLNPLDFYVWGAMLHQYEQYNPKPTSKDQLKVVLREIWNNLPVQSIKKAVLSFRKRLQLCIEAGGGHIEHLLK
jgi:inhibitor of nuclear factor kappa-B kinase subunit alpha